MGKRNLLSYSHVKLAKYFFADDEFKKILEFGECNEEADEDEDVYEVVDFESEFRENFHKNQITAFDLYFCSGIEAGSLTVSIVQYNVAQTEEQKKKYQNEINKIREGYKEKYYK